MHARPVLPCACCSCLRRLAQISFSTMNGDWDIPGVKEGVQRLGSHGLACLVFRIPKGSACSLPHAPRAHARTRKHEACIAFSTLCFRSMCGSATARLGYGTGSREPTRL